MKYSEFNLVSANAKKLFACEWETDSSPRGVMCLIHGLGEHCGRYTSVVQQITEAGYSVLAFDLPGHGKTPGKRGHIRSYNLFLDDISLLLGEAVKRYPGLPCFLYGHSLGGNIVLNYALRNDLRLTGIISTSPWLKLAFQPKSFLILLGKILNRLWPSFTQSNKLDRKGLSHRHEVVEAYDKDPLVHDRISIRLFDSANAHGLWAIEHASECRLPILLMHGSSDPVTSPEGSREYAENAGSRCTFKEWDGLYHELHNESSGNEIIGSLIDWMQSIITKAHGTQELP